MFSELSEGSWQDFETFISEQLNKFEDLSELFDKSKVKNFENISFEEINEIDTRFLNGVSAAGGEFLKKYMFILFAIIQRRYPKNKEISKSNFSQLILWELKLFESEFKKYMDRQIEKTPDYFTKAGKLLLKLCDSKSHQDVMSFNYTSPLLKDEVKGWGGNGLNFHNIHGTLADDNIIFGINVSVKGNVFDGKSVHEKTISHFNNEFIGKFTKTYRSLFLPNKTPFYSDKTQKIKFFGHSLGDADFTYFKVIFDSIDLFNNPVFLEFYYSDYDEKTEEELRLEQVNAVVKLFQRYEDSIMEEFPESYYKGYIFDKLRTQGRINFIKI